MARRKADYPLQKVTLYLREGDMGWLQEVHGRKGASKVIRDLVMGHRERVEKMLAARAPQLELDFEVKL